jgi:hypothetical protein
LGTGWSLEYLELTEYSLGPYGQIAGRMPIDGVVAQFHFGNIEMSGQGALDLLIVGPETNAKLAQWDVEAATFEADVEDSSLVQ